MEEKRGPSTSEDDRGMNLIEDNDFWRQLLVTHHRQDVQLPIALNLFNTRDLADLIHCPKGCCECCHYEMVPVSNRDIERLREGAGVEIAVTSSGKSLNMVTKDGCRFLFKSRCSVYQFRPDACYYHPLQLAANYDADGRIVDPTMHIRLECPTAATALRSFYRRILRANPRAVLQRKDLSIGLRTG